MEPNESQEHAEKAKKIRKQLMIIFHVFKCIKRDAKTGNGEQCDVKHCAKLKKIILHLKICRNDDCTEFNCKATRTVLTHWNQCEGVGCLACGPLKDSLSVTGQNPNKGTFMGNIIFNMDTAELCVVTKNGIQLADISSTNSDVTKDIKNGADENGPNDVDSWEADVDKIKKISNHMERILKKHGHTFTTVDELFEAMKTNVPKIVAKIAEPFLAKAMSPKDAHFQKFVQSFPALIETIIHSALLTVAHNSESLVVSDDWSSLTKSIAAQSMQTKAVRIEKSIKRPSANIDKSAALAVAFIGTNSAHSIEISKADSGISIEKAENSKPLEAAEKLTTISGAVDVENNAEESKTKENEADNTRSEDGTQKRRSGRIAANGGRASLKRPRQNDISYLSSEKYQRRSVNDVLMLKRDKLDLNSSLGVYAETMACPHCQKVYKSKYHYKQHIIQHENDAANQTIC